ncbi:MAG TPA: hypothetical protein VL307_03155 [Chitinophagaceae bacterium]|nr:hypothetical protein [Chitinophagaceae bacterium]
MADLQQPGSFTPPVEPTKLPSGLNTLTILTLIGCGIGFLFTIYNFFNAKSGLDKMEATLNSPDFDKMPDFAKKMFSPEALEVARKSYESRVPLTLIGLVGLVLCLVGAMQMRKLKAQGYLLYVIGEILPVIGSLIFIGMAALSGIGGIIMIGFTLLFIILYTTQRKYLINK